MTKVSRRCLARLITIVCIINVIKSHQTFCPRRPFRWSVRISWQLSSLPISRKHLLYTCMVLLRSVSLLRLKSKLSPFRQRCARVWIMVEGRWLRGYLSRWCPRLARSVNTMVKVINVIIDGPIVRDWCHGRIGSLLLLLLWLLIS